MELSISNTYFYFFSRLYLSSDLIHINNINFIPFLAVLLLNKGRTRIMGTYWCSKKNSGSLCPLQVQIRLLAFFFRDIGKCKKRHSFDIRSVLKNIIVSRT